MEGDQKGVRVEAPSAPLARNMFGGERAARTILTSSRDTKAGCMVTIAPPEEERERVGGGEKGGLGPPKNVSLPLLLYIFPLFFLCASLCLFSSGKENGEPNHDGRVPCSVAGECRSGTRLGKGNAKNTTAAMAIRATCSRIGVVGNAHTTVWSSGRHSFRQRPPLHRQFLAASNETIGYPDTNFDGIPPADGRTNREIQQHRRKLSSRVQLEGCQHASIRDRHPSHAS